MANPRVKQVFFSVGVECAGNITSANHIKCDMEATGPGIKMVSKREKTNGKPKILLVPWANIKCCELFNENEEEN